MPMINIWIKRSSPSSISIPFTTKIYKTYPVARAGYISKYHTLYNITPYHASGCMSRSELVKYVQSEGVSPSREIKQKERGGIMHESSQS